MEVITSKNLQEAGVCVAEQFVALLQKKPAARLGLATGGSVEGVYAALVEAYRQKKVDFSQASTINLDEYIGLDGKHEQSYRHFMNHNLFDHINIDKEANTYVPDGTAEPQQELQIFRQQLQKGVDLQLLGVGANGHIGFNEPDKHLLADAHIENLLASTIEANSRYFSAVAEVPKRAFTQGIGDILRARHLVLIASGAAKLCAIKELLSHNRITSSWPVTFLKLHPAVTVVIDQTLAAAVKL